MPDIELRQDGLARSGLVLPPSVAAADGHTQEAFVNFFFADIRNSNTRAAYLRAVARFLRWLEEHSLDLFTVRPLHASAYIEELLRELSPATVKQHRAALVRLFDYLVSSPSPLSYNPVRPVRGPKQSSRRGKTPAISTEEVQTLFESIPDDTLSGIRDRALIATLLYSCARISAVVSMQVEDYIENDIGSRSFRLSEKGGKHHVIPAHHKAQACVNAYLRRGNLVQAGKTPLFRSISREGTLTDNQLDRVSAWKMIKRRCRQAGIRQVITSHSARVTGATALLEAGVSLESVQFILNHADPRTTKVYDRRDEKVEQSDIERMQF